MSTPASLSPLGALVRRADPDRFLTALFAPADRREALFTLYAFNHETARAREAAREPMMAMIRLQWWREVVEGSRKQHEVATPLSGLLETGALDAADLLGVLDAREVTELATVVEWRAWLLAGPGALAHAAGRLLGVADDPRLRTLGAAYGAAGMLRSVASQAGLGMCLLPGALLAAPRPVARGGHGGTFGRCPASGAAGPGTGGAHPARPALPGGRGTGGGAARGFQPPRPITSAGAAGDADAARFAGSPGGDGSRLARSCVTGARAGRTLCQQHPRHILLGLSVDHAERDPACLPAAQILHCDVLRTGGVVEPGTAIALDQTR